MKFTAGVFSYGVLLFSLALTCSAKSKPPLFFSPDFNAKQIDRIDVFVIDPKNDTANNRECIAGASGYGNSGVPVSLPRRGYNKKRDKKTHTGTRLYVAPIPITDAMLLKPDKSWLHELADRKYFDSKSKEIPSPGRWIMVITIDELGSGHNAVKGLGKTALSMYLFDRDQGSLLWHDQAISEHTWGGLLGNVMDKGGTKEGVCGDLAFSMVMKLPKR